MLTLFIPYYNKHDLNKCKCALCNKSGGQYFTVFGSFGLSTKEPYTTMDCPSCVLVGIGIRVGIGVCVCIIIICAHPHWHRVRHRNFTFGKPMHICPPYMCGVARNTWHSGCTVAALLSSFYGHFKQFWVGVLRTCPKHIILLADVMSLNGTVMSFVTSQHHMCVGHVTFYYKRATKALVWGSCLLFVRSSGLTLSPETRVWLVSNTCRS